MNRSNCPICGYFTGTVSICPRCGAEINRRIAIKAVRRIAVFGSVIGIVLLWYTAYLKQPAQVKIGDIKETMNNALVVIEGEVTHIRFDEKKNTLKMTVNDGTGNIKLNAFNKLKKFRDELGENMPVLKDRVRITGSLNISLGWGVTMFLSIPSRVEIVEKYTVIEKPVGEITKSDVGELLWIEVEMIDYEKFTTRKGFVLHKFLLADRSGEIEMVLYDNDFKSLAENVRSEITQKWNKFKIQVEVTLYRGNPQVRIVK